MVGKNLSFLLFILFSFLFSLNVIVIQKAISLGTIYSDEVIQIKKTYAKYT